MNETIGNVTGLGNSSEIIPGTGGIVHCPSKDGLTYQKCTSGYCCKHNTGCCDKHLELWWFVVFVLVIIAFSLFCAYNHHRVRNGGQSRDQSRPRGQGASTYVASCSYPGPPTDGDKDQMGYCKLPKYGDQTHNERSPPPPYRSVLNIGSFASVVTDSWNSFWHQSTRAGINQTSNPPKDDSKENSVDGPEDMVETRLNLTQGP